MSYAGVEMNEGVRGLETNLSEWYQNYLGREPDQEGWDHYMGQLLGGRNVYEVASEIQYSPEGQRYIQNQRDEIQGRIDTAQGDADRFKKSSDAFEKEVGVLQGRIGGLEGERDAALKNYRDLQGRYDDYKIEMEENVDRFRQQYETELAGRATDKELYDKKEADFLDQLNAQARAEADAQLRDLRAGSTAASVTGSRGPASLASGQTTASRQEKGSVVGIRPQVDATDSVLDRSGPVVQLINRIQARKPSGGSSGARSPLAGGGAGNYYASRFG
jgi:hypothetical protein|tara:strand:+ start:898 stop:1722 length:825 start_codon:yes stop_codon:yes gene_type:complete